MNSHAYFFLIIVLISAFIFGSHYKWYQNDIVLEQDGLQFIEISKPETIIPHDEPIVFISERAGLKRVGKFMGYGRRFTKDILLLETTDNQPNDYYFVEAIKGNLVFTDTLKNAELEDMVELVNWGEKFDSRQLIQHALDPGMFGYIDTMPLIFLVIALPFFVLISIVSFIVDKLVSVSKGKLSRTIILSFLIAVLIYLLAHVKLVPWFPSSTTALLVRNVIAIVPVFFIFQYWLSKKDEQMEFWRADFFKFSLLFVGIFILILIGNECAYPIDVATFDPLVRKPFFCEPDSLSIGLTLSFSIGNLLHNLLWELWERRE